MEHPLVAFGEERDHRADEHQVSIASHKTLGGEQAEVHWLSEASARLGCRGEAEEICDCTGSDDSGPEAPHRRVCWSMTVGFAIE